MVKIRLRRMGNSHRPFYRVVVAHSTRGRNGSFKELIGTYNPLTKPKEVKIDKDRALHWLLEGAQPTETVSAAAACLDFARHERRLRPFKVITPW